MICECGAKLKKSKTEAEFFGISFGIRGCELCPKCGSVYFDQATIEEIEKEVKRKKLFGLEKRIRITKSGNSLVIRIPKEIAKFLNLGYKDVVELFPISKERLELEIVR